MRLLETVLVLILALGLAYFAFSSFGDDRVVGVAAAALVLTLFLSLVYSLDRDRR